MRARLLQILIAAVVTAVPCAPLLGAEVGNVGFSARDTITWDPAPGAQAYNVYIGPVQRPTYRGHCYRSPAQLPGATIELDPTPGIVWEFQVTALYPEGEGPMGHSSAGVPRESWAPCVCTQPKDIGPCDGDFPRWFFNYLTGECEEFRWGGCEGNENNFPFEEYCEAICPQS